MSATPRLALPHLPRVRGLVRADTADPVLVARWAFTAIAVAGVAGVAQRVLPAFPLSHLIDLDFEWVPPALLSSALLLAAAVRWSQLPQALPARFVAVLLGLMSLDELVGLHEGLERVTGVDWEVLYAPVVLAAAFAALLVLRTWGPGRPSALLVAGGACWFVAQVLEALEWDGDVQRARYALYMVPEELLEMTGSTLLLLAALWAIRLGPKA